MAYKTILRERALKEYLEAIAWYESRSLQASKNFMLMVQKTPDEIEGQPNHFRLTYRNYREAKIKKFPFNIVYFIDVENQIIIITSLFHQKRNPKRKFK